MQNNKDIEFAIRKTLSEEVITVSSKANGIYVQGDRLDTFVEGMVTAVYSMARTLGMDQDAASKIINNCWSDKNEKH